jgi:hypothetical protein
LANNTQFDAETVIVSRYGAKLRIGPTHRNLLSGEHVRINMRGSYNWRAARVAWLDRVSGGFCGIELQDPENFWGIYFPRKGEATTPESATPYTPLAVRGGNA